MRKVEKKVRESGSQLGCNRVEMKVLLLVDETAIEMAIEMVDEKVKRLEKNVAH